MKQINLLAMLFLVLCFTQCKDDDDDLDNELKIEIDNENPSAIRGEEATVRITLSADDDIKSFSINNSATGTVVEPFTFANDTKVFTENYTFTIPADAKLSDNFTLKMTLTDDDNDSTTKDVNVGVAKKIETAPTTYEFTRDGESTVSYSGQNERLDMVEQIKSYLSQGDKQEATLDAAVLNAAYENENGNGGGFFDFESTKQLKNKSFGPDVDDNFMSDLFAGAAAVSQSNATASNGNAGYLTRENSDKTIMVDEKGREYTQLIEKGLMGTVMYNQIYNAYLSDSKTGDDIENTELNEGKNYTAMEHHWDEAFGYFNPPLDFSSNWPDERKGETRFWSKYSNVVDPYLGTNQLIMNAFLEGRTAIVNNDMITKNEKREELYTQLELVAAGTAVHYINETLSNLNAGNTGEAFHTLSEAWAFVNALKYHPNRGISASEIDTILNTHFGTDGNFWTVSPSGLNAAKDLLVEKFSALEDSKDVL